jgi:hypothetical protein
LGPLARNVSHCRLLHAGPERRIIALRFPLKRVCVERALLPAACGTASKRAGVPAPHHLLPYWSNPPALNVLLPLGRLASDFSTLGFGVRSTYNSTKNSEFRRSSAGACTSECKLRRTIERDRDKETTWILYLHRRCFSWG